MFAVFFFNDTATTEIYTLSLHDALPISTASISKESPAITGVVEMDAVVVQQECRDRKSGSAGMPRPISYAVFCLKKNRLQAEPSSSESNLEIPKMIAHSRRIADPVIQHG